MCIGAATLLLCAGAVLQVVNFSDRTGRFHLLGLERFADHTGREAWDYSAWVRVYSSYLDERVGAFRWVGLGKQAGSVCILVGHAHWCIQVGGSGAAGRFCVHTGGALLSTPGTSACTLASGYALWRG